MMLIPKPVFPISKIAARENARYAINGVCVQRDSNGVAVATVTDGLRLLSVSWSDESAVKDYPADDRNAAPVKGFSTIVPTHTWDRASKAVPENPLKPVLAHCLIEETTTAENRKIRLSTTDLGSVQQFDTEQVDGKFPVWGDVVPTYDSIPAEKLGALVAGGDVSDRAAVNIGVDPKLFGELLLTIARMTANGKPCPVRLEVPLSSAGPIKLSAECDGRSIVGVQMPIKLPD